jgi:hypothetical protein
MLQLNIEVGQIWSVSGGHGLMQVAELDSSVGAVLMRGHGGSTHWFYFDRLRTLCGPAEVKREQREAGARKVSCNSPGCWCLKARRP